MKITVDRTLFCEMFRRFGRKDQFSYEALNELFRYYEEMDDACGTETELDVIAICCEWTEFDDSGDLISAYGHMLDADDYEDADEFADALVEELYEHTTVIPLGGTWLVQEF